MKTTLLGALTALTLVAAIQPAAAETVEFTLVNESSLALHYFYTTPTTEETWGDDLLGETGTLESGEQGIVTIGDGSDQCVYDFKFVADTGAELIVPEIDICALNTYTLTD